MDTRATLINVTAPLSVPVLYSFAICLQLVQPFRIKKNLTDTHTDTCRLTAWPSKRRPSCAQTRRGHVRPVDQSRILAGTNLRMIISRMAYLLKHEGEDNSAIESRDSAGMVT